MIVQIKVAGTVGMLHQLHHGSSLEAVQLYAGNMGREYDRNDNVCIRQVQFSKLLCSQHCQQIHAACLTLKYNVVLLQITARHSVTMHNLLCSRNCTHVTCTASLCPS